MGTEKLIMLMYFFLLKNKQIFRFFLGKKCREKVTKM